MSVSFSPASLLSCLLGFAVVVVLPALKNVGRTNMCWKNHGCRLYRTGGGMGYGGGGDQKLFWPVRVMN